MNNLSSMIKTSDNLVTAGVLFAVKSKMGVSLLHKQELTSGVNGNEGPRKFVIP